MSKGLVLDENICKENIRKVYREATTDEVSYGEKYYLGYYARLFEVGHKFGYRVNEAAGAFAALSPNNTEQGNWLDLVSLMSAKFYTGEFTGARVSAYPLNKEKAIRILSGSYAFIVLGGEKTLSFYWNIVEPTNMFPVTVDVHAIAITQGKPLKAKSKEVSISKGQYALIAAMYREIAKELDLVPNQLQAITWNTWKRMHGIVYTGQLKLFPYVMI